MNVKDKLAAGRLYACNQMKYFRSAIMCMIPRECPDLGTFAVTDKAVMLYDPKVVEQWSVETIGAVMIHEVSHLLRKHSERCQRLGADPTIWNIAADMEINDDLVATGLKLPDGVMLPKMIGEKDGGLAEEYYRVAESKAVKVIVDMPGAGGKDGDGEGEGGQDGEGDGQGGKSGKGKGKGKGKGGPKIVVKGAAAGKCGACSGNGDGKEHGEKGKNGRSDVELDRMRRATAEAIRTESQNGRGTVPAGWLRWANEELSPPKIPWQQKLARVVRGNVAYRPGAVDYRYTHPSRRQAGIGYGPGRPVLPALRAPRPKVAIIVDTSGSMGGDAMVEALSECRGILAATGAEVEFCACDAAVHSLQSVARWQDIPKLLKGGGGTDMRPALDALAQRKNRPDLVICMTDGMIGDAGPSPAYRVIWLLIGQYAQDPKARFGDVLWMKDEPEKAA